MEKKLIQEYINEYKASPKREWAKTALAYYKGNNVTINSVKKNIVIKQDKAYVEKENPFISNYKIANNYVKDMVDQKVFALLERDITVSEVAGTSEPIIRKLVNKTLKKMAINAALSGNSYAYIYLNDNGLDIKVFDTQDCIGIYDKYNEKLESLIRFFNVFDKEKQQTLEYVEVYEVDKMSTYISSFNSLELIEEKPYITTIKGNVIETEAIGSSWEFGLPIIELINNEDKESDFTASIRGQIDAIDIVLSDFANNLADFQDVYWVIKGLDTISAEEMGNFMETIKTTYKVNLPEGADVDTRQIEIPTQARVEFVEQMKKQLISNTGVVDTNIILTGGLTATAIRVASEKLRLSVAKLQMEVEETALKMVYAILSYQKDTVKKENVVITFNKSFLQNDTEVINNLNMSLPNISQETYLENHPYVTNVKEELERLDSEVVTNFELPPVAEDE